jgi:limonene-1,2-epoxide hydrolase
LRKVATMSDSAESVVRKFLAANLQSDVDELIAFFSDDAVYTDGPRGVHRGIDAIRAEFREIVKIVPSTAIEIKTLVSNGGTVIVERVDRFEVGGTPFGLEVVGVFEVDDHGRINRWRDYYDLQSIAEQTGLTASGQPLG